MKPATGHGSVINSETRLEDLKAVAAKLSVELQFHDLSDEEVTINSGYCKLNDRHLIILDRRLSPEDQISIIIEELKRFDLEIIYIPSWIRERMESRETTPP